MQGSISRLLIALAVAAACADDSRAQEAGWQPFVSLTPVYESDADLDRGGDFKLQGVLARAGASRAVGTSSRVGLTVSYDYYDSTFSNPVSFGGVAPWNIVQRYGASVPMFFGLGDGWSLGVAPSVDWIKENGARSSDSLVWGGVFSAVKSFPGGNRLGFGVAAFDHIEERSAFPIVIVDWRLSERWRLTNPIPTSPSGPAGLELDYRFDSGLSLGVGAAYRTLRFRLSERNLVANGVGEMSGAPVFVRATTALGPSINASLYLGTVVQARLRVENSQGNLLREDDFDPAALIGLTLTGRF